MAYTPGVNLFRSTLDCIGRDSGVHYYRIVVDSPTKRPYNTYINSK